MSKKLKLFVMMFSCILLNVNYALGDSYTWTMAVGDFGTTASPSTSLSSKGSPSKNWSVSYTWNQEAYIGTSLDNNDRGLQLGAGKKSSGNKAYRHLNSLVLSTSGISGTISEVAIETAGASSITATVGVVVGSTSFTCESENTASLTSSNASYSFTGSASGTITITWSQPSTQKAIYVKSITITYSTGSTKTVLFPSHKSACSFFDTSSQISLFLFSHIITYQPVPFLAPVPFLNQFKFFTTSKIILQNVSA